MSFEIRSGVQKGCALFPTLFNNIIDWILGDVLRGYPGVQVGANVHVSDLAYDAWPIQGFLEGVQFQNFFQMADTSKL